LVEAYAYTSAWNEIAQDRKWMDVINVK